MTATSGNDEEEEDGDLGDWIGSPSGFTVGQRIGMKPPTVEYFYFSGNQFCLHFRTKSVSLLVLQLQTPVDVQPCFALILSLYLSLS